MSTIKTALVTAVSASCLLAGGIVTSAPADAAAPYCGITWGSTAKTSANESSAYVLRTRAGEHACYDRLVVDLGRGSGAVGYTVKYVTKATGIASGLPITVKGGAIIQITVNARSNAKTVMPPKAGQNFTGYRTFQQLKSTGSFEGRSGYALGVRARLPMRVMSYEKADGTWVLVVDVAHRW